MSAKHLAILGGVFLFGCLRLAFGWVTFDNRSLDGYLAAHRRIVY
jgi:hypothetical protein